MHNKINYFYFYCLIYKRKLIYENSSFIRTTINKLKGKLGRVPCGLFIFFFTFNFTNIERETASV